MAWPLGSSLWSPHDFPFVSDSASTQESNNFSPLFPSPFSSFRRPSPSSSFRSSQDHVASRDVPQPAQPSPEPPVESPPFAFPTRPAVPRTSTRVQRRLACPTPRTTRPRVFRPVLFLLLALPSSSRYPRLCPRFLDQTLEYIAGPCPRPPWLPSLPESTPPLPVLVSHQRPRPPRAIDIITAGLLSR